MPVTNACAWKGARTLVNSEACATGTCDGTPCCACLNSGLVEGVLAGGGGWPKFGGVVETTGVLPRFEPAPSSGTLRPAGACSWLPALSVASARNW